MNISRSGLGEYTPYIVNGNTLLSMALLTVQERTGKSALSLPDVLAALAAGQQFEFAALRPHQQHPWHAFLVQLAALAAHRQGWDELPVEAGLWRAALLALSAEGGGDGDPEDAWRLVVGDPLRPAFLQSPVPPAEVGLAAYRNAADTPDALDVVVTTRNHDVKQQRMGQARPEHWIYALVSLQTMAGFFGRGNYGIARMNGGFASRPGLGYAPSLSWAQRFQRDVRVWREAREGLVEHFGYPAQDGPGLLWLLPWNGKESIPFDTCDPFFIEIARRVRLVQRGDRIAALLGNTDAARLEAKASAGNTGDIWTPVSHEGKALTVGPHGLRYDKLSELLFGAEIASRPALVVRQDDGREPILVAQVLARGQGKTDGYHERLLPIPEKVKNRMADPSRRQSLGELAAQRVQQAKDAEQRVLHPALCALLQGGEEELKMNDRRTQPWISRLDAAIDREFFTALFADSDEESDAAAASARWQRRLRDLAHEQLLDAARSAPTPVARRPRALAVAERTFRRNTRSRLPLAFADSRSGATREEAEA